jgi:uncharacterized ion transporter superfamily protein YfcC
MKVITILFILLIILAILIYLKRTGKHKHKWEYMHSTRMNTYTIFYCKECMAQATTNLNDSGLIEVKVADVRAKKKDKRR